MTGTLHTIAID